MKRPLTNIVALVGGDAGSRLLGFAASVYLGRVLGASSFGVLGIGFSVLGYLTLLSSPGVHIIGTREVASSHEGSAQLTGDILAFRLVAACALVLLAALCSALWVHEGEARLVILLLSLSAVSLALSLDWYFQGKEQMGPVAIYKLLAYTVYLGLALLLVHSPEGVVWSALAFTAGSCVATLWLWIRLRRQSGPIRLGFRLSRWRPLLRESAPLGFANLMSQTATNLPVLVIGIILAEHEAGLFNASLKLVFFVLMIDRVIYPVLFPVLSRHAGGDPGEFARIASVGLKLVVGLSVPVAIIGVVFAREILTAVYGGTYESASGSLQFLFPYVVFTLVNTVLMSVLVATKRQGGYVQAMTWGTGAMVVMCVLLTPAIGIEGTAASISGAEILMTALLWWKGRDDLGRGFTRMILPTILGGLLLAGVLLVFRHLSPLLAAALGLPAFFVTIFLLRGWSREDVLFLRKRLI